MKLKETGRGKFHTRDGSSRRTEHVGKYHFTLILFAHHPSLDPSRLWVTIVILKQLATFSIIDRMNFNEVQSLGVVWKWPPFRIDEINKIHTNAFLSILKNTIFSSSSSNYRTELERKKERKKSRGFILWMTRKNLSSNNDDPPLLLAFLRGHFKHVFIFLRRFHDDFWMLSFLFCGWLGSSAVRDSQREGLEGERETIQYKTTRQKTCTVPYTYLWRCSARFDWK